MQPMRPELAISAAKHTLRYTLVDGLSRYARRRNWTSQDQHEINVHVKVVVESTKSLLRVASGSPISCKILDFLNRPRSNFRAPGCRQAMDVGGYCSGRLLQIG